jgi:hypothetical protein
MVRCSVELGENLVDIGNEGSYCVVMLKFLKGFVEMAVKKPRDEELLILRQQVADLSEENKDLRDMPIASRTDNGKIEKDRKYPFYSLIRDYQKFFHTNGIEKFKISPWLAKYILDTDDMMHKNRPLKEDRVIRYRRDMQAGNWSYTGDSIKISPLGRILDGQHRLKACVESDHAFDTVIAFGVEDSAQEAMDGGMPRSNGDKLSLDDHKAGKNIAAAIGWVYRYKEMGMKPYTGTSRLTYHEMKNFFNNEHRGIEKSNKICGYMCNKHLGSPSMHMAFHYLFSLSDKSKADDFYKKLSSGAELKKENPIHVFREKIRTPVKGRRYTQDFIAHMLVKTWNLFKKGENSKGSFRPDKVFPEIE